jgi:hypothetical protein
MSFMPPLRHCCCATPGFSALFMPPLMMLMFAHAVCYADMPMRRLAPAAPARCPLVHHTSAVYARHIDARLILSFLSTPSVAIFAARLRQLFRRCHGFSVAPRHSTLRFLRYFQSFMSFHFSHFSACRRRRPSAFIQAFTGFDG